MKYFFGLVLITAFLSCNNKPIPAAKRPKLLPGDSNVLKSNAINPYSPIDISPMDMSYFPDDYPVLKMSNKTTLPPVARVIYSRPHKQGRKIFGTLLKYGEPWRLGANESTEIEFFRDVTIQNKKIPKGEYVLYCIPQPDKWTIIFNGNLFSWGLKPDPTKDLYKFDIPVEIKDQSLEDFTMVFKKTNTGADLLMAWDNVEARLPFQFSTK